MDTFETYLASKEKSKSVILLVLSGIVISGLLKDFGDGGILLSDPSILGEKYAGEITIRAKDVLAWGDGRKRS